MAKMTTVGGYLIQRLEELNVKHVFGVPGDYVLGFYDMLVESKMDLIGTCTEAGAGFAADAYARVNGLGVLCVTYCVGGLNTVNAVAGAYAEKSPLVVLSGAPGMGEREHSPLLHHKVRDFHTQLDIFEHLTVASAALEDARTAPDLIDEVLAACLRHKRPVYLELPRDIVSQPCRKPIPRKPQRLKSDPDTLAEAVAEAAAMLKKAKRPVILGGVELHRFGLQDTLLKLVEKSGIPVAATLLGKSVIRENHPQYLGIYEGAMGREDVCRIVEKADCVLILGAFMTDINLGIHTAQLDIARTINATSESTAIKRHRYDGIKLKHFIEGLAKANIGPRRKMPRIKRHDSATHRVQPDRKLEIRRFFSRMNSYLDEKTIVISDIGDSLFGAADLTIQKRTEFLSPAYYTSMGFAVPAALGAQARNRRLRPLVFVGDGAFQMTGMELSSIAKEGLDPIIFVLNNKGYSTERFINEGPYNDIHDWAFHRIPELLNAGWGCEVRTEGDLEDALDHAKKNRKGFSIINVHLDPMDCSHAMERLGKRLKSRLGSQKKTA
ncbi:MAG: alpha-keto acid decarboxylase family protein [Candidatus Hydrogenedentes bacterium]|nr:alpha-keto acid decarboxylase family protein [Candidatus Hydrogenedentota bacterium]